MNSESTCVFCERLEQRRPSKTLQNRRCPLCDGELLHDGQNGTSYRIDANPTQQAYSGRAIWLVGAAVIVICTAVALLQFSEPDAAQVTAKTVKVEKRVARVGMLPTPKSALRLANYAPTSAKAKAIADLVAMSKAMAPRMQRRIRMENPPPVQFVVAKAEATRHAATRSKPMFPVGKRILKAAAAKDWEKRLLAAPEIGLGDELHKKLFQEVTAQQKNRQSVNALEAGKKIRKTILAKNAGWKHMPWLKGAACQIKPNQAKALGAVSLETRTRMALVAREKKAAIKEELIRASFYVSNQAMSHRNSAKLKEQLELALPAFHQIYMAEPTAFRHIFISHAGSIPCKAAVKVLAKRAVFDTSENVRGSALMNLDYMTTKHDSIAKVHRDIFLKGIMYPIPEVSKNAANALIQLGDTSVVPKLTEMLDDSDPTKPFVKNQMGKKKLFLREVVRINHHRNCLVCHAPMHVTGNPVPGIIPSIDSPLPPPTQVYYGGMRGRRGIFVRADITYLRQQFSVMLPVKDHGKWPKMQRFDFLVRERPATKKEIAAWEKTKKSNTGNPYRRRILHVLEQLTGLELAANQKTTREAVAAWQRQLAIVGRNSKGR